ncbi:NTP transferase domain-containing protein [Primorskyibacter flagellatus]|uniref:CTP:molybdopterin cytidylyltransferase MocA n=1 Tax=Primorskyibacter flagellatus TaxID=1387277 RepID=A0A1W1Z4T3_9RHOB|nr:nucleotidyltransferase family protein [Primorskyibacter flagellatus]SMC43455.1 CTP:molybdopterin cytidylyltransferase MocA [Primorskyibacter flagellatus]
MKVAVIIPAAGASRRMRGADKLLQDVDGKPLLRIMAERACAVSDTVFVTLPNLDHPRANALDDLSLRVIPVPDAAEGMAASLRAAARALPDGIDGALILPADMPDIKSSNLDSIIKYYGNNPHAIIQGSSLNEPGHPVLFPADCLSLFKTLSGDRGARPILQQMRDRIMLVPLPGRAALTDLDTPEAWTKWRASR